LEGVSVVKNALIRMRDGVNLAADLYLPDSDHPCPANLVYSPYRKDDLGSKAATLSYFAQRGHAGVVVDIRGTGSSEGQSTRMMSRVEREDGYDVVEWIAEQPWCNGKVGMWGVSYPGFTSLQVAAMKPPHLGAIAPIDADPDLYLGFAYPGGCLNALQLCGGYGPFMLVSNLMSPLYFDSEARWKRVWDEHLEKNEPWLVSALAHPFRDAYWKESSILDAIEEIEVPVLAIGSWRDLFPSAPLQLYSRLKSPKKIIVGPWVHGDPDTVVPPPRIDYLELILRWWDYWLKGQNNGIMDDAPITIFVQGKREEEGAVWRGEDSLPSGAEILLYLSDGTLAAKPPPQEITLDFAADDTAGVDAGLWDPMGATIVGLPLDQRRDDAVSLIFDSEVLEKSIDLFGIPRVNLFCSFSSPRANVVVKLNDVSPERRRSTLISTGWMNLEHVDELHEKGRIVEPGSVYSLAIPLGASCYRIMPGHRIRLSISGTDFPRIWPSRSDFEIRLRQGEKARSSVVIPILEGIGRNPTALRAPSSGSVDGLLPRTSWKITRDPIASTTSVNIGFNIYLPLDPVSDLRFDQIYEARTRAGHPYTSVTSAVESSFASSERSIVVRGRSSVSNESVNMNADIIVDGVRYYSRSWQADLTK
jgi:putative CocE/NonD family hydrolase